MNIKKNTWHHQFYTFLDRNTFLDTSNVCKYIRGVTAGMILTLLLTIVLAAISIVLLDPIVSGLAYMITGISHISFFGVVIGSTVMPLLLGYLIWGFCIVLVLGVIAFHLANDLKDKYAPAYLDSKFNTFADITKAKIKSKHDKICLNIKIVG